MTRKNQRLPLISKAIEEMIEQATVDALNESEQITGWFTMIDENLAVPFETTVLGVPVTVEGVDLNQSERMSRLVSLSSTIKMRGGSCMALSATGLQGAYSRILASSARGL
jgi:Calcium binding